MRFSIQIQTLAGIPSILIFVGFIMACSSQARTTRSVLPDVFTPPASTPDFSLPVNSSAIERLILNSRCGSISEDLSQLSIASGLITRPATTGGVYLDKGRMPDGTKWFLHRAHDDPETTYCGIALIGLGKETNVSVTGVRFKDMDAAKAAVEFGDFLCRCKQLSN